MSMMSFTYAGVPIYVDLRLVCAVVRAGLNVDVRASPAFGSWVYMRATRPVGLKSNGGRARTC